MVQVPTTTPSTGYRNNILHISYCAAGVSRQGRRPEVIPAVSSFFPFSYPSYFISSFFSLTFSSISLSLLSLFHPPPLSSSYLSYPSHPSPLSSVVPPYSGSHSFFFSHSFIPLSLVFSQLHPSHTPLFSVAPPYSCSHSFFFSHSFIPLSFLSSLSYTPPIPPPRHSSILPSGLVSFPASNAPSPEKMLRTCRSFRPKCHRSRKNPSD